MLIEETDINQDLTLMNFKDKLVELESAIISAHKKYFSGNSESQEVAPEQAILYGTVIRYFSGKSS